MQFRCDGGGGVGNQRHVEAEIAGAAYGAADTFVGVHTDHVEIAVGVDEAVHATVGVVVLPERAGPSVARFLGLRVAAISTITNMAAGLSDEAISHEHTGLVAVVRGVPPVMVLVLLGFTLVLGLCFVSLGIWISSLLSTRARATSAGLTVWLFFLAMGLIGIRVGRGAEPEVVHVERAF